MYWLQQKVPAVLKNISFQVENKELIGVVGPTGSGKVNFSSYN